MERVDHRSNRDRGIDRTPQIHLGNRVWAMKQKGIATDRGARYTEIEERNTEIDRITAEVSKAIEFKHQSHQEIAETPNYQEPTDWTDLVNQLLDSPLPKSEQPKTKQPEDNSRPKPKSWWQKAANFVFGEKPQSLPSATENQTQSNKQQNYNQLPVNFGNKRD